MVSAVMTISSAVHRAEAASDFSREMYSTVSRGERPAGYVSSVRGTRTSKSVMPMRRSSSCRRGEPEASTIFAMMPLTFPWSRSRPGQGRPDAPPG